MTRPFVRMMTISFCNNVCNDPAMGHANTPQIGGAIPVPSLMHGTSEQHGEKRSGLKSN